QCDDGNTMSGDGCATTCVTELGYTCSGTTSVCMSTCGDGLVPNTELRDGGKLMNGDGCSAICNGEPAYGCNRNPSVAATVASSGTPSVCATVCGDGIQIGAEQCDDGNTMNGDCCSSTCQLEPTCEIEPNNNATQALANGPFPLGAVLKGRIAPVGDLDYWAF